MTLHMTFVCGRYVLQLSDRLVSVATRFGIEPFERTANKTVVYFARDAYVSIGYTGLAYLKDRTTDQWIAETLIGEEVESRRGPSGGISQRMIAGPMPPWFDIGTARQVLRRELIAVTRDLPPEQRPHFPQLFIAGWQRGKRVQGDRRLWRPIAHRISDAGIGPSYRVCPSAPRDGWERGRLLMNYTPEIRALAEEQEDMFEALRHGLAPDAAAAKMAEGLLLVADRYPKVIGKDYLVVLLPSPSERNIRVRYFPSIDEPSTGQLSHDVFPGYIGPVGYTPWIVHPFYQAGPAVRVISQSWEIGSPLGSWILHIESPSPPPGGEVLLGFTSQLRQSSSSLRRP